MTRDEYLFDYDGEPILYSDSLNISIQLDCTTLFPTPNICIYDNAKRPHKDATKVATLSLLTDEIFYRGEDWIDQWILTKREIRMIRRILRWGHPCECRYNYWQMACISWNKVLDGENIIKLPINWDTLYVFDKKFDEMHKNQPLYIPSTQPIPHWHY